jgi:two-component system, cell cycle sensor histidine kinase and response regulator CckA
LTQQLLTFSKGGSPIKKNASITELLRETSDFILSGSKVRCEFSLPDNLWSVEVDEGQISQVINNLIINARQAMPKGGIIKVCAENVGEENGVAENGGLEVNSGSILKASTPGKGNYVKISVKDQGSGIPKEYLSKIFDPYFTTKEKGSGLGLATSYSIIKKHGGYISVESEVGVGTTFYVYLPASMKEILTGEDEQEDICFGHGNILLMDDQESIREMVGEMLSFFGYEVESAGEGTEAINLYKKAKEAGQPFDAVILDLTVPGGMGGEEVVQKLLEIDPQVKAIVSSGYSDDLIISEYKQYGFSGVVIKPYDMKKLSEALHKVISNR